MVLALIPLVLGIVVGLVRGGKLENFSAAAFRQPWMVFAGLALQVGAQAAEPSVPALHNGAAGPAVLAVSYALVIGFVVLNIRFPGTLFIGVGLLLNLAVILANGAMPVSMAAVHAAGARSLPGLQSGVKHHPMGPGTHLDILGDIIPVPALGIVSVGDVILGIGIFLLIQRLMAYQPRRSAGGMGLRRERPAPKPSDPSTPTG